MKNNYNAENVVRFIDDFIKNEEQFDNMFFDRLSCMFTTVALMCDVKEGTYAFNTLIKGLWEDIQANYDEVFTNKNYDTFYNAMAKRCEVDWDKFNWLDTIDRR